MQATTAPTWQQQRFSVPADAAVLFGYYVSRRRAERGWKPGDLVAPDKGKVTAEWLLAVEHGQVELTREAVLTVQRLLNQKAAAVALGNGRPADRIELLPTLNLLVEFPYGELSLRLRQQVGLSGSRHANDQSGTEPTSVRASISASGWLLVIAPVLAFAAVWAMSFRMLELSFVRTSDPDAQHLKVIRNIVDSVVWPLTVLGSIAVAFALSAVDGLLARLARSCRRLSSDRTNAMEAINQALWTRGVPWSTAMKSTSHCVQPGDEGFMVDNTHTLGDAPSPPDDGPDIGSVASHLIPAHRGDAISSGLRCRLAERLEACLLVGLPVAAVASLVGLLNGFQAWDLPSFGVVVATAALMLAAWRDASKEFKTCASLVGAGLGFSAELANATTRDPGAAERSTL